MGRKRQYKGPESLVDKVRKFDPEFADSVYSYAEAELTDRIVKYSKEDEEIDTARKNDPDLKSLREQLSVAQETYTVPLKCNKLRRKLIFQVLQERGKL